MENKMPFECDGRMTVFETVGQGSIPWRGTQTEFEVLMRDRLTVGSDALNVVVLVRIQLSHL